MSRVAKSPITLPAGVEVIIKGQDVQVKGGKGVLSFMLNDLVAVSQKVFAPRRHTSWLDANRYGSRCS